MATKGNANVGVAYQIPRNSLLLLMISQVVVVLPHIQQLSPWIIAVCLFCCFWRSRVYLGHWAFPKRWIKVLLVIASVAGVALSGVGAFSLEAATSLLVLAFALKLVETKSRRDAYLVIFMSYFVIATQFLFDQSIAVAVYEIVAIAVVTAAMVGMNQLHTRVRPIASLKLASSLVLQALPFTLILFLFFPRIAPLWTVPLPAGASTGISDRIRPGDVAALTQSDELAFRAVFESDIPMNAALYWRGLVYSNYHNGTWSVDAATARSKAQALPEEGDPLTYEVILEPTLSKWLFALDTAVPVDRRITVTEDYRLVAPDPVMSVYRYQVDSYPQHARILDLSASDRLRDTRINPEQDPRLVAYAQNLYRGASDELDFAARILTEIRTQPFSYTLNPPLLPDQQAMDAFWFDTQAGFCSHYAGAFVMMMRSVGIPARVVGGYQGGEVNPITNHLVVRQYDAHAWAEIWVRGQGWVRMDPTSAVAPERIQQGLRAALSQSDRAELSLLTSARLGDWQFAGDFLRWTDSLEHRWNMWVIGYDPATQNKIISDLIGAITPTRVAITMFAGGALSLGAVALVLFWRRRPVPQHPVEKLFLRFASRAATQGYRRRPEETPRAYLERVGLDAGIDASQVRLIVAQLEASLYNPNVAWGRREMRTLRGQLRRLQFRLAFGSAR
jgi:transglutaminase-like putative cysteine protease